jgi:RimJ/RimL family protein N-acetyltransferase
LANSWEWRILAATIRTQNSMITNISEENFIDFQCPHCGELNSFPADSAGLVRECAHCMESLIVPEAGSAAGRKIPLPLTTARLILRRLDTKDWKDLLELFSDEEIYRYDEGHPLDEEEILRWLQSDSMVKLTTPGQPLYLGIEARDGGKLIGQLDLRFAEPQRLQAQLTIRLNPACRRQGVGREAVDAILDFCFKGIHLHRVTAHCDTRNVAACGLCEKAGLRREGEFVKDRLVWGEWTSSVWYAALDEEHGKAVDGSPEGSSTG